MTAALNNAQWCAAVWTAHKLPVHQRHGMWFTPAPTPQYYPNVVTVDPRADPRAQIALITELAPTSADFSVKDSFARLDLSIARLAPLFDARWLWCEAPAFASRAGSLDWIRLKDEAELERWEGAWRGSAENPPRVFLADLLGDERACILAGLDRTGDVRAGGIGYNAAGVMGITNVFGSHEQFMGALVKLCSPRNIVCYEQGRSSELLETQGFQALSTLRVWKRRCSTVSP